MDRNSEPVRVLQTLRADRPAPWAPPIPRRDALGRFCTRYGYESGGLSCDYCGAGKFPTRAALDRHAAGHFR